MKNQGHVKSIAIGGRANTQPMQAVGGVKGGQLSTWYNLFQMIYGDQRVMWEKNMDDEDATWLRNNWVNHHEFQGFTATAGVNIRDVVQPDHVSDGISAQFVHEDADCRLFYTRDMIVDVTNTWKKAARAAWNGDKCVSGGISKRSGTNTERKVNEGARKNSEAVKPVKTRRVEVREESVVKDEVWRMMHGRKAFE